jgi:hypothetical protein
MAFYLAGGMAVAGAYTAYSANQSANRSADLAAGNASRRYALKANIAENQMEEQNSMAMEKMTDVARNFLKARGTAKAMQAESMVGGNVTKRIEVNNRMKESETKGKVAKEVNTNILNIAQDMLAEKIDTEALIAEALSKKKNGMQMLTDSAMAGVSSGLSGYQLSSSLSAPPKKP